MCRTGGCGICGAPQCVAALEQSQDMGKRIQSLADEVVKRMDEQEMRRQFASL